VKNEQAINTTADCLFLFICSYSYTFI